MLGFEKGDVYNQKLLNKRVSEDDDAVANLYMNNGYLFFQLIPTETKIEGDSVDLEMRIYEGKQARIKKVVINGNDRLYEKATVRKGGATLFLTTLTRVSFPITFSLSFIAPVRRISKRTDA